MTHRPRKRFGQNFLHDQNILQKILHSIAPQPDDHVVEIGPGQGALTDYFVASQCTLDCVEIDRDLIELLTERYQQKPQVKVHSADALQFDFSQLCARGTPLRVVGNLPYNISTPLLFHLFNCADFVQDMTFLLQKEVVDRICARPGTKDYGRLSVISQYHCVTEKLFTVAPGCFNPPPKVFSAVVRLLPRQGRRVEHNPSLQRIVTTAFSYRRKRISNALKGMITPEQLLAANIDPALRADQISVEQYLALANML